MSPNEMALELRPAPEVAPDAFIQDLRVRINALSLAALESVEWDGVAVDGRPHPMLFALTSLIEVGTDMRRLAVDRRIANAVLERRGQ
ncbi:hypothetical protein [Streptomyces sp. MJM8645]|uniref:hypothetical protein n=1 Tax=Streptomyces sp. MJM8645 TaxID=1120523 RepID=UPI0007AF196D|nr:hypothetical protein [Streptomyces sp. MJM8645]